ncbi:hypothetical protein [Prosthecobacter debontii]|nr:hypothetical protein [Prosthecobacter debontii]
MIVSVTTVASLWSWCLYKVLTQPNESENLQPVELHTPDMDQPE